MSLFVNEEALRQSIIKDLREQLNNMVQVAVADLAKKTILGVLADVFGKPIGSPRTSVYGMTYIPFPESDTKVIRDHISKNVFAEVEDYVDSKLKALVLERASQIVEEKVGGEGFLDRIVERLRKKQLPGAAG